MADKTVQTAKRIVIRLFSLIGLRILSSRGWSEILALAEDRDKKKNIIQVNEVDLNFIDWLSKKSPTDNSIVVKYLHHAKYSKSALRQDVIALAMSSFKTDGFFIEVGACDGLASSNSLQLERNFNWKGILMEPATIWHDALRKNRTAIIDTRCAWKESGISLVFEENESPGHSGIKSTKQSNSNTKARYNVESITLNDLLIENKIKVPVDFLSVDTEGSELEVLSGLNFDLFRPRFICVEHNFETEKRVAILKMMNQRGYQRILPEFSYVDDWYVTDL